MASSKVITCQSTDAVQHHASLRFQSPHFMPADDLKYEKSSISAENVSSQQEQPMDVRDTISPSALVAYNYRPLHTARKMAPALHLGASSQQYDSDSAIDSALCVLRTMCDSGSVGHDQRHLLKRTKSSLELFTRLCNAPPIIVDARDNEHTILERYRHSPHNIVLDSLHPKTAPHIVITPAEDQWNAYEVIQHNRAGPQFVPHLTVPPFFGSTCRMHTYEEFLSVYYPPLCQPLQQDVEDCHVQHLKCTDTWFDTMELGAQATPSTRINQFKSKLQNEEWACFIFNLAQILTIQARKLVAIEASLRAGTFRERYDTFGYLESTQRPFEWIDPAKFILADKSLCPPRTSIIMESDMPLVAPHIVIHLAPPNVPMLMSAYPNSSQNVELLMVPLPYDTCRYAYSFDSDSVSDDGQLYADSLDALSDTESSGPKTPILQRVGSGFFSAFSEEIEQDIADAQGRYKEYNISAQYTNSFYTVDRDEDDESPDFSESYTRPASKFFISSHDDDFDTESLPDMETDEWFIQARTRSAAIVTSSF